jgi:hypothetical protein
VPEFRAEDDALSAAAGAVGQHGTRLFQRGALQRLPLRVAVVELRRDLLGAERVPGQQQLETEGGILEPSGGVDAGGEPEADGAAADLSGDPRDTLQRLHPYPLRQGQQLQSIARQDTVRADKRHHVCDGTQRDQIEVIADIRLIPPEVPDLAQPAAHRYYQVESDTDSGERLEREAAPRLQRIHDGAGFGKPVGGRMMVGDDEIDAALAAAESFVDGAYPAIDGDEERGAAIDGGLDAVRGEPIPLGEPLGDEGEAVKANGAEEGDQEGDRGDAIDVVIAMNADPLPLGKSEAEPVDRVLHAGEKLRIVKRGKRRVEVSRCRLGLDDAAVDEEPGGEAVDAGAAKRLHRIGVRLSQTPGFFCDRMHRYSIRLKRPTPLQIS